MQVHFVVTTRRSLIKDGCPVVEHQRVERTPFMKGVRSIWQRDVCSSTVLDLLDACVSFLILVCWLEVWRMWWVVQVWPIAD